MKLLIKMALLSCVITMILYVIDLDKVEELYLNGMELLPTVIDYVEDLLNDLGVL